MALSELSGEVTYIPKQMCDTAFITVATHSSFELRIKMYVHSHLFSLYSVLDIIPPVRYFPQGISFRTCEKSKSMHVEIPT